jgi:N-acetylneuraminic acid mutarotase
MAYLPTTDQILLVGGRDENGPLFPEAFTFDLATSSWQRIAGDVPYGVIGCAVEWMPNIGRAIVFSGAGRQLYDDTWSYEPETRTFTNLEANPRPPGRSDAAHAYDPVHGRLLIFSGGVRAVPPYQYRDDMWAFDGSAWTQIETTSTATVPSPRRYSASAFDPIGNKWLVWGGTNSEQDFDELWAFDVTTDRWQRMPAENAPPAPRGFAASAYDPTRDAMLVVGGFSVFLEPYADGWLLQLH